MNYKIVCIKKACAFRDTTFEELMNHLNIKYSKFICGKDLDEIYLEPWDKVTISRRLNVIVPYFYGIIDDEHLFKNDLDLEEYNKSKRSFKIEDYLRKIGLGKYVDNIFDPLATDYISNAYFNELLRNNYDNFMSHSLDEKYKYHLVKKNPLSIREISNPSTYVIMSAVSSCGEVLQYIDKQTEEIAYEAVCENGQALKYVFDEFHTEKVVKTAVKKSPSSFKYSKLHTYDICLDAVKMDGNNLEFVPNEVKDYNLIMAALNSNGLSIKFVDNQNEEYALTAVLQNTKSSLYIDENIRENNICIKSIYKEIIKNT